MELELPRDFKELLMSLNSNGVRYLLIGGYAVIIHGYIRFTADLDVVVSNSPENVEKCVAALAEFGFGETKLGPELFSQPGSLVRIGVEPIRIEMLNYLKGLDFDEAYERRIAYSVEDIKIDVISLPDLITNKTAVHRPKDLLDVQELKERNKLT
jgi:predicted nucleotidyltransferase